MAPLLHTDKPLPCTLFNRIFALIYTFALLTLFYHHLLTLLRHPSVTTTLLLISDLILAFLWATSAAYRLRPITRHVFPENLPAKEFPALDVFICTADPYKEPPMNVVNTALSLMAYDYPPEKMSVYVSDDGGSELTMFAFMEAAKFAKVWLPFCRENKVVDRCPEVYFRNNVHLQFDSRTHKIKETYEKMKTRVENAIERGEVSTNSIDNDVQFEVLNKYRASGFTRQQHHAIIQVLIEGAKEKDNLGEAMPNLIYVSREKDKNFPHHFKAGALNALLRVSGIMTNSLVVLTQDCDMYSNDPQTPYKALCFILDSSIQSKLGYVQFPQRYHGINKDDIYGAQFLRLYIANSIGMDGLQGSNYVGSGCFFLRQSFFGGPMWMLSPEIQELKPDHVIEKSITSESIIKLAHHVVGCNYEDKTHWGSKMGFRYGSLVEDFNTGYHLHCEGWKSIFYHPDRPAFLGDIPITLIDDVSQKKRWTVGLLEVAFSKYNPVVFGIKSMGPLMAMSYAHYTFWPFWSIPVLIYSFLPQIALLNGYYIFPKATNLWFFLYIFLFLGAYGQDLYDFILFQGTFKKWWNDQRMWLIRSLTSFLFGSIEYTIKHLGIATQGFHVTSKVLDEEQNKRYDKGLMEFGVHSLMFLPFTTASIVNLLALVIGTVKILYAWNLDELLAQTLIAGFGVLNSWPIYEAMVLRRDKGRMPIKTTLSSVFLALALCFGHSLMFLYL